MHYVVYSWLREQHAVAGGINSLFARSLESRMKMFIVNPLFVGGSKADSAPTPLDTPNQSFTDGVTPLTSSTPFTDTGENSTCHETAVEDVAAGRAREHQAVDMIVENPIFGSGLRLKKVCSFISYLPTKAQKYLISGQEYIHLTDQGTC